jgi:hypothetical protein
MTTLHQAAASGDVVDLRRLVAKGAKVDERDADGATALHWAAAAGQEEAMRVVMELGANKEATTDDGRTLLHSAAGNGHVEAIKVLLEMSLDKDSKADSGATALSLGGTGGARGGHQAVGAARRGQGGEGCWWSDGAALCGTVVTILIKRELVYELIYERSSSVFSSASQRLEACLCPGVSV